MTKNKEKPLNLRGEQRPSETIAEKHVTTPTAGDQDNLNEPKITFSVVTKNNGILTKKISLVDGVIGKDSSQCTLAEGDIETYQCTPEAFSKGLLRFKKNMGLVHGVSDYAKAKICSAAKFDQFVKSNPNENVITRSKEFLSYPDGPGLLLLDHDKPRSNAVAEDSKALQSFRPKDLIDKIADVFPAVAGATWVSVPSTSSCIYDKQGNELRGEGDGSHVYLFLTEAADAPRFLKVLGQRLILAGYGRIELSRSGAMLERTLVDLAVASPERLDFVAGAVCSDDLEQHMPAPYFHPGRHLDTTLLLDLTDQEIEEYNKKILKLKNKAIPEQVKIKSQYINVESDKLSKSKNIDIAAARVIVESRQNHILRDDDLLYFQQGNGFPVTVRDVLASGGSFDKQNLADPLEPEYDGASKTKAKFYWNNGENPIIKSYAHGGIKYSFAPKKNDRSFRFVSAADLQLTPPRWLIEGHFEEESTIAFFGKSGDMKTFMILDIGLCIATGHDWHGHAVKQGCVMYICGEGKQGIKRRINAWEKYHNLKADKFFVSTSSAQILSEQSLKEVEKAIEDIDKGDEKLSLIIIDTLNRNFGDGDENSTKDMTKFNQGIDWLVSRTKCAVATVHHSGLVDDNRGRGSTVLKGAMDFEYQCKKSADQSGNPLLTLTPTKCKDYEFPGKKFFKANIVDIGIVDTNNKPITSLVISETAERHSGGNKVTNCEQGALNALKKVFENGNATEGEWEKEFHRLKISNAPKEESRKKAFSRAKTGLITKQLVNENNGNYEIRTNRQDTDN